jgi:hypothetical protein
MDASAYLFGRDDGILAIPFVDQDKLFAAQRLDGQRVERAQFEHCTFANISFKEGTVSESSFLDCVFIGCYLRRADLSESSFIACKFIDCEFPRAAIRGCSFRYAKFSGCIIPFDELKLSLPQEPNLREELSRNLAIEARVLGLRREANAFRMQEISAREEHLRAAMKGASQWYRDHYDSGRRIEAALRLLMSISNRVLWGYGERAMVLLRNAAILALGLFPLLFLIFRDGISRTDSGPIGFGDALAYSLKNFLPAGIQSDLVAQGVLVRVLSGMEAFIAVIAAALFASYLFRWILNR